MTLAPGSRLILTQALCPPPEHTLDRAVGTTYSLDLTSLLLTPLAFASLDPSTAEADTRTLFAATRQYAERTTVFCQAGKVHVPASYKRLMHFVEDCVVEVPTSSGQIFHPKVWVLRFTAPDGSQAHRVVVLSRNLTMDRSWDTVLVLDEDPDGTIEAAPAAQFLQDLATRVGTADVHAARSTAARLADVRDLARTLSSVRLAAPSPFTDGELLPIGLRPQDVWPFPETAKRVLAISPFLGAGAVARLGATAAERHLISRQQSISSLRRETLEGWRCFVLKQQVEAPEGEDAAPEEQKGGIPLDPRDGLHAKTFVVDLPGGVSHVVTGSANLTREPFRESVEFDVRLEGPTKDVGVAMALEGRPELQGLRPQLDPAVILDSPVPLKGYAEAREIEQYHSDIAAAGLRLNLTEKEGRPGMAKATLQLLQPVQPVGTTRVWPVSIAAPRRDWRPGQVRSWDLPLKDVTPFITFETTLVRDDVEVCCSSVLKAQIDGIGEERRREILSDELNNADAVLDYLAFLLRDLAVDPTATGQTNQTREHTGGSETEEPQRLVPLLEQLMQAMSAGKTETLARVHTAMQDLARLPELGDDGRPRVPAGFAELWQTVWAVHQETQRGAK